MNVEVIGTGSDGNSFLFDDTIIIDIGLSFKKLNDAIDVGKITHILLTHIHGDHLNKTTARKMYVNNENVIFVCGKFLAAGLAKVGIPNQNIVVVNSNVLYEFNGFKVAPFDLYHDVPNFGYRLVKDGVKHIHATDTSTLYGITANGYDTATIECNHDVNSALKIIERAKEDGEFSHLQGAMNSHLSIQQTIKFCKENKIRKLIPVHIGNSTKKEVLSELEKFIKGD